jgi:4-hydroxy-tetrahydrodipicolinate reductase
LFINLSFDSLKTNIMLNLGVMVIGIGIIGASGKMGQRLLFVGSKDPEIFISGKASHAHELNNLRKADLLIDFSNVSLLPTILEFVLQTKKPLVIGTTGYSPSLIESVRKIAESLPKDFSVAIEECHHIHKKDAPSGTALAIAAAIEKKESKISSKREGEIIGEHEVVFASPEEKITLRHSAVSRDLFAKGALLAAKFLISKPAGLYTMADLL